MWLLILVGRFSALVGIVLSLFHFGMRQASMSQTCQSFVIIQKL